MESDITLCNRGHVFIVMLFVVGKDSSSDWNWGFAFVRSVYPWLGITQTKNDAQLYIVREEFFDNQVTKKPFKSRPS